MEVNTYKKMDNITSIILAVINDLKLFETAGKLVSLDEMIWRNTGERIYSKLSKYLSVLIDYLKSEYQQGHKIDPQIDYLRDSLQVAETAIHDAVKDKNKRVILEFQALRSKCAEWKEWIDRYYPQAQDTQDSENKATPGDAKHKTAAAERLASQELQELKRELVKAELIKDERWTGSPADFGELVRHLKENFGVENRGGYAWKDCRDFVGYEGSDKSAQNAITSNVGNIRSDAAAIIRDICIRCKGKLKNREI